MRLLLFFLIVFTFRLNAQQLTDLLDYKDIPDFTASVLCDSAASHIYKNHLLCIKYSNKAIHLFGNTNKKKIEELYFIIGSELQAMNRQDLYFEFSEFLLKESKSLSDKVLEGHSHYFKFKFYYYHFNDFLAKEELNQALKKYAELKTPQIVNTYYALAEFMINTNNEEKALEYFKTMFDLMKIYTVPTSDKFTIYVFYSSCLTVIKHRYKDSYLKEINYYNTQAKEMIKNGVSYKKYQTMFISYNDIFYALKTNNYTSANEDVKKIINYIETSGDISNSSFFSTGLIQYYLYPQINDLEKAEYYCNKIIDFSKGKPVNLDIIKAYKFLGEIAIQKKDLEKVRFCFAKADYYQDTYLNESNRKKLTQLEAEFNVNKLKLENKEANEKLQTQKSRNNIFILSSIFLSILTCLFFYLFSLSKRFNKQLTEKNKLLENQKIKLIEQTNHLNLLNKKLSQSNESLQSSLIIFEESNKKLEFLGNQLSHDLRAPVRITATFAKMFLKKYGHTLNSEAQEYLNFIKTNSEKVQQMIIEVLENAKTFSYLQIYTIDLNKILKATEKNFYTEITNTKAVIETDSLPIIEGYESEMMQLFINIIGNALKYRKKNTPPFIQIKCNQDSDYICITFTDHGIGILESDIHSIFDMFKTNNQYEDSYGIGLTSCLSIVRDYGGNIKVESEFGKGSSFIVTLRNKRISSKEIPSTPVNKFQLMQ